MANEFISSRDAVHLLAPVMGSDTSAKEILFSRIQDYSLKLFAEWMAMQLDMGPIPVFKPKISKQNIGSDYAIEVLEDLNQPGIPFTVGGVFINRSLIDTDNDREWRWSDGTFVVRGSEQITMTLADGRTGTIASRWVVGRAQFKRVEIEALANSFASGRQITLAALTKPNIEGEALILKENWWNWMAELAAWVHEEGVNPTISANRIIESLANQSAKRGVPVPSRSVLYAPAQVIAIRLRSLLGES